MLSIVLAGFATPLLKLGVEVADPGNRRNTWERAFACAFGIALSDALINAVGLGAVEWLLVGVSLAVLHRAYDLTWPKAVLCMLTVALGIVLAAAMILFVLSLFRGC